MSELWRDLRLAARVLVHQRGFAFIVVLMLAVGLASNATVMAMVDALVLRPFPLRDIDRLVQVFGVNPAGGQFADRAEVSPADVADWQREVKSAESLVALEWWDASITGGTEPERLQGFRVSPAFFDALGVGVSMGRGFMPEEGQTGRDRKVKPPSWNSAALKAIAMAAVLFALTQLHVFGKNTSIQEIVQSGDEFVEEPA